MVGGFRLRGKDSVIFKRQQVRQLAEKSFDEILKPFRAEVEASGISDDELDDLFRQARRFESERGTS